MKTKGKLRWVAYVIIFLGLLWTLLPLYWMVITSVKPTSEVFAPITTFFPHGISWDGFHEAWTHGGGRGLKDSAVVALGTLIVSAVLGVPAAYAVARFRTGGSELPFVILSFRFMPPIAPTVAFWVLSTNLGIYDTYWTLIMVNSMASIPFVVWIMKGFIEEIPYGIEEAAQVDGASWFRVVMDHVMPLAAPGLVAVSLFVWIFTWNEFLFATLLTVRFIQPFPKAVPGMTIGVFEPHWGAVMAMGMMVVVPIMLLSFYMQKYIVRGMSYGAIRE